MFTASTEDELVGSQHQVTALLTSAGETNKASTKTGGSVRRRQIPVRTDKRPQVSHCRGGSVVAIRHCCCGGFGGFGGFGGLMVLAVWVVLVVLVVLVGVGGRRTWLLLRPCPRSSVLFGSYCNSS